MSQPPNISVVLIRKPGASVIRATIPATCKELVGEQATFEILVRVKVNHTGARDAERVLYAKEISLQDTDVQLEVPLSWLNHFSYKGSTIDVKTFWRLSSHPETFGLLGARPVERELSLEFIHREGPTADIKHIAEHRDKIILSVNWNAIDPKAGVRTRLCICLLLVVILLIVCDLYAYNQAPIYLKNSYIIVSLLGNAFVLFIIIGWILSYIKKLLRNYVIFSPKIYDSQIIRHQKIKVSDLVAAIPKIELSDSLIRLVAYNTEHGEYVSGGGGTDGQVVTPIEQLCNSVVIYEKTIPHSKKGSRLQDQLNDEVTLDEMYDRLYPPNMVFATHGLSLNLEAQLIHPELADLRTNIPIGIIAYSQFLEKDMRRETDIDPIVGGRVVYESPNGRCVVKKEDGKYFVGERGFESERKAMDFLEIAERRQCRHEK